MNILIVLGYVEFPHSLNLSPEEFDFVIAADKGYEISKIINVNPQICIGDFDSAGAYPTQDLHTKVVSLPKEKDLTDSEAAVELAISKHPSSITMVGGLGGRMDHTMGNLGILQRFAKSEPNIPIRIIDGKNRIELLLPGHYTLEKGKYKYLSLLPACDIVKGCCLSGVKYPMSEENISPLHSRTLSNEILAERAMLSFDTGKLWVMQAND